MFDPYDPEFISRLNRSIDSATQLLRPYRENYLVCRKALFDPCHTDLDPGTEKRQPVNALDKMFSILTRGVVDQNPTRRIVRTKRPRVAGMLKSKLDYWSTRTDLATILQGAYHEALLRWGIVYMGVEGDGKGWMPYADVLDFDDYFIDMRGNVEDDIDFEGHGFCRRIEELKGNPLNDPEAVEQLTSYTGRKSGERQQTLYDWAELRCVWLPKEGVIVTLPRSETGVTKPIRVVRYEGPPWGPYLRLNLGRVRGSMVPVSRASMLLDLHEFEQRSYRHVFAQADRAMEFFGYAGEAEKDADKHRTAMDGEYVKFDNPQAIVRMTKAGVNSQTLATAMHAGDRFNQDAGNLNLIGGLGTSAETLGQERQLGVGVQQFIDDSRNRVHKLANRIDLTVSWYFTHDVGRMGEAPELIDWMTPNGNMVRDSQWTPDMAQGMDPWDPEMDVIPGSMISRSSEGQIQSLVESFQLIGSSMALPGEEPPVFKHRRFRELLAEYRNQPEIAELFGEAADQAAVVPGVESAGQFARQRQQRPAGGGQGGGNKMVERLIYSGGGGQPQAA